ncbi:methyltransferase family protein [Pseudoalteromonas luteoviolacea]|uniref:Steroid 5-alpha reductase C-terminal domain-containing protein n=1 Tax=Pseudoalteromonas luteoviolacea S4054 TaxID=1129367 RepID=A0A0F6ABS2_9GAMM|nr:isoprenylcysteine carboxylmethyltransferase family protein [Pseudoalteromonas luteoviolacea]AOT08837.1 hypothetical protein S4054249_13665 [Pseudoalteromonas luteoviolacea]AOT13750.1 hypothetical protein S40542_13635 [Pseudoalteromonas luteoviolacea]AOT18664.1 hypothetical protein S4054_13640 [Pseudoalteromonas luteoviolacea]KKE83598.1 hypothetical protein N479_13135 [Pseudoalteromonas luteoviolacea S4054]KZN72787.1 hypothetical protein N481_14270 [Pseudoalteromonas luteoviolacea S4047-1]
MQKLLPPFLYAMILINMVLLCWLLDTTHFIVNPYNLAGIPLFLIGLLLAVGAKKCFVREGTNVMTFGEPDKLVTQGAFKFTRNPMYLGFAISLFGTAVLLGGGVIPVCGWLTFIIVTDRWYIRFEEHAMRRKFGQAYERYCCQVKRWI